MEKKMETAILYRGNIGSIRGVFNAVYCNIAIPLVSGQDRGG